MGLLNGVRRARGPAALLLVWTAALGAVQAVHVRRDGGALRVQAPAFTFIEGEVLSRLRDGQALHLQVTLAALARAGSDPVARVDRVFTVSFDLWEERFAVTRITPPRQSVSHLTARDAEAWCLDSLTLPLADLARFGRNEPFWIRLAYEVQDPSARQRGRDDALTLRRLIDYLSQRGGSAAPHRSIDAGPFLVPE